MLREPSGDSCAVSAMSGRAAIGAVEGARADDGGSEAEPMADGVPALAEGFMAAPLGAALLARGSDSVLGSVDPEGSRAAAKGSKVARQSAAHAVAGWGHRNVRSTPSANRSGWGWGKRGSRTRISSEIGGY